MKKILLTIIFLCNTIYSENIISISPRFGIGIKIDPIKIPIYIINSLPISSYYKTTNKFNYDFLILPSIEASYLNLTNKEGIKLGLEYSLGTNIQENNLRINSFERDVKRYNYKINNILTPSISYVNNVVQMVSIGFGLGIILPEEIEDFYETTSIVSYIPTLNIESAIKINDNNYIGFYSKTGVLISQIKRNGVDMCQITSYQNRIPCVDIYAELGLLYRFNISL